MPSRVRAEAERIAFVRRASEAASAESGRGICAVHPCHRRVKKDEIVDAPLRNKAVSPDFQRNRLCILTMQTDRNDGTFCVPFVKLGLNVWETNKCRMRNRLPSESVGVRPFPFWGSPAFR